MKTISLELSKRLNELWLLDNIETEYIYRRFPTNTEFELTNEKEDYWLKPEEIYNTLILEEAIEFLPETICDDYVLCISKKGVYYDNYFKEPIKRFTEWESLLDAIEKMIEYLLDNNLLWKQ